jgi:nucleotide-binding universal stress UspA family protein
MEKNMTIVSGTDFSENATQAALAAASIAKRLSLPLKLVHIIDELGAELVIASDQGGICDTLRQRIRNQAIEIGTRFGIDVEPIVEPGFAHEKLIEIASAHHARLIVVSSLGDKKQHRWLLGSVAERVAQTSPIPVLIVRKSASIEAWARGERVLRMMVGVEIGSTSKAALHWAAELRAIGRCDLLVTHVTWPFGEHFRLGIPSPIPLDCLRPELHELLMRDLRAWAGELPGDGQTSFSVNPGWGRIDTHLALLASDAKADLLVVGTHQRAGSARLWQGSVSRGVLHHASCNVACVPRGQSAAEEDVIPTFRRVLIPTDFSPLANRAIPVGYGMVTPGGIVHLLHVVTRKPGEDDIAERLRALVPKGAAAKGVVTEVEVIQEENAWIGIWHAAGRLGVDAICMATHGRSGMPRVVLGSQAQEVMQRARQPVILVPPEREG